MESKQQILNLSSDLRRIAWWSCDKKNDRGRLTEQFLALAQEQIDKLKDAKVKKIIAQSGLSDWQLVKQGIKDKSQWAEEVLTASLRLKHLAEAPQFARGRR